MKPEDLSFCGIDCNDCDVFKATATGDEEARARAHKVWLKTAQQHWGMETLDPAILSCRGCRSKGDDIFKGCRHCPMRNCAQKRGLASCGLCPEWETCDSLAQVFADEPKARANLEAVAKSAKQ